MGKRVAYNILNELFFERVYESSHVESESINFVDLPICFNTRKMSKVISQSLSDKYQKVFSKFGGMFVDVNVYSYKDPNTDFDDVISSLDMALVFDNELSAGEVREIQSLIRRFLVNYPDFKYEKRDSSFWFEVDKYEDIIDVVDTIIHTDRVNLGKLYKCLDADEAKYQYEKRFG